MFNAACALDYLFTGGGGVESTLRTLETSVRGCFLGLPGLADALHHSGHIVHKLAARRLCLYEALHVPL